MNDGLPENANPFVVLTSWNNDVRFDKLAPQYFNYDNDTEMPYAKEVIGPALSQSEAEDLVRLLAVKGRRASFAVHEKFRHIVPKDLKKSVRITQPFSPNHGIKGFFVPCCTEEECERLD